MKLPSLKENSTPQELLIALDGYINSAEKLLDDNNMVDLSGMDAVVDAICARVLKLSPDQHRGFADQLEALGGRLSMLQKKMIATQAALKSELGATTARQKASRAYRKDPA